MVTISSRVRRSSFESWSGEVSQPLAGDLDRTTDLPDRTALTAGTLHAPALRDGGATE
ncbi:hypothetical protein ACFXKG_02440 [Streptomyces sp. NPDC059255]|uniref:hypothetical protein n=1 Tax=Streptomyces sp. NPDC059255 TaxID=3346793 RepID=UPI00367E4099